MAPAGYRRRPDHRVLPPDLSWAPVVALRKTNKEGGLTSVFPASNYSV